MKQHLLAIALLLPLAGCPGMQGLGSGTSAATVAGQVSIEAEKALTIAHLAYNALGSQLIAAAQSGVLKGANATKAKAVYDQAGDALKAADTADKAANETNLVSAIQQANTAIAQAQALLTGGH